MKRLVFLLALIVLPQALAAQDSRLAGRLDPATLGQVTAIIDSAKADGLSAEPLVQKALEGASKHAPGDAIVRAVRGLALSLRTVRIALGAKSSNQELLAGAAALRAGATPDALRELRQVSETRSLAVPLSVLADLVSQGIEVNAASRSVLDLARTHASDEEYLRLKQQFDGNRRP